MARDHRRLRVFHEAHSFTLAIYKHTRDFPRDEWFGIRAQIRRGAVSIASNIVEGNARRGTGEYVNFLNIARGSAAEVAYLIQLASELGFLPEASRQSLDKMCDQLIPQLESLIQTMDALWKKERKMSRTKD
jgi:four helix bundle protein